MFEKVSQLLKCHSNFLGGHIHIHYTYIKGHKPRSHTPLLTHAHVGEKWGGKEGKEKREWTLPGIETCQVMELKERVKKSSIADIY